MASKSKDEAEAKRNAPEAVEVSKPISFEETILTEGKPRVNDPAMPLDDPDFQALMRTECEFREQSSLPVDESVLQAVRSRWAALKAAKQQAKA